ncbi:hypothetical protein C357_14546 [Citreicella sp. 357]|nr:hypothetical protein C357_14546 [Citreicella sp. 357]
MAIPDERDAPWYPDMAADAEGAVVEAMRGEYAPLSSGEVVHAATIACTKTRRRFG